MTSNPGKSEIETFQEFANTTAQKAGEILIEFRNHAAILKRKTDFHDIATEADIASEKYIIDSISQKFPDHNVLSEERGDLGKKSEYCWIIDPLDGTKEFIRQMPTFNVSIALEWNQKIITSVVYQPVCREMYSSGSGLGAISNRGPMQVSDITELKNAFIWTHLPIISDNPEKIDTSIALIRNLIGESYRVRSYPDDVISLAMVAQGSAEAFYLVSTFPKWWDIAPGILFVEEAGGIVTDTLGNPIVNHDLSHGIVATNGKIHDLILKAIQSV